MVALVARTNWLPAQIVDAPDLNTLGTVVNERIDIDTIQTMSNKKVGNYLDFANSGTAPAAPAHGAGVRFYARTGVSGFDAPAWVNELNIPIVIGRDNGFFGKARVAMTKGTVVYVWGATTSVMTIDKAQADSGMSKIPAIGVLANDVAVDGFGYVMQSGLITATNTAGIPDGSIIYVSPTTAGGLTATRPVHPAVAQQVGIVVNGNSTTTGSILVSCLQHNPGLNQGTNGTTWAIGDGIGSGVRSLLFKNSNTGTLSWTPNANYTLTLPNTNGTLYAPGGALGTPASGNLSSCNSLPVPGGLTTTAGTASSTTFLRGDGQWQAADWNNLVNKPSTFAPTIGTTSATAKAGDYQPTWAQVTSKTGAIVNAEIADATIAMGKLNATGIRDNTKFLRDDGSWQPITVGGNEVVRNSGVTPVDAATDLWIDLSEDSPASVGFPVTSVNGQSGSGGAVNLVRTDFPGELDLVENKLDINRNVNSALTLTNTRTIGGVNFNGSGNVAVPYDLQIVAFGRYSTRGLGTGDNPFGIIIQRNCSIQSVTFRCYTQDGSSVSTFKIQKVVPPSATVIDVVSSGSLSPAQQIQLGGITITAGGPWAFAAGDILLLAVTSLGGTPYGNGLVADLKGTVG